MEATSDDARRRANIRSALVIGGTLGAAFVALVVAVLVKGCGEGAAAVAPGAVEVLTGAEWKQLPDGKRVQTRGKVSRVYADGIMKHIELVLPDETRVSCIFDLNLERLPPSGAYTGSDLEDWIQQLKPGAELVIVGRGSRNPPTISLCDTIPPIKRIR